MGIRFKNLLRFNQNLLYLFLLFSTQNATAQIAPENMAQLNFTQVMFAYDQFFGADNYQITIIPQTQDLQDEPQQKILVKNNSLAAIVSTGLAFGKNYKWYYEAFNGNQKLYTSFFYRFYIVPSALVDKAFYQYNITVHKKEAVADNLIFLDNTGVAINRDGVAVWYMPPQQNVQEATSINYRNLRMTNTGTLTYLKDNFCGEFAIDGRPLWRAPDNGKVSGEKVESYHHDFERLDDNTYVACGYSYNTQPNPANPAQQIRVRYNTLIQYDYAQAKVLWSWTDKGVFDDKTIFFNTQPIDVETAGTHMNGFYYDKTTDAFLLSFRNISRLVKVDRKTGKTLYQVVSKDDSLLQNSRSNIAFSKQHTPTINGQGEILFYNNNTDANLPKGTAVFPLVSILSQPKNGRPARHLWDYECRSDSFPDGIKGKEGSAYELPNKNILVSIGGANRCFEITRKKEVVWECFFRMYTEGKWQTFTNYRTNFTSSLYPKCFSVERLVADSLLTIGSTSTPLKLNNEGSDKDVYTVEILSKNNTILPKTLLLEIAARSSTLLKIQLKPIYKNKAFEQDIVSIKIFANSNPSIVKIFEYVLAQKIR